SSLKTVLPSRRDPSTRRVARALTAGSCDAGPLNCHVCFGRSSQSVTETGKIHGLREGRRGHASASSLSPSNQSATGGGRTRTAQRVRVGCGGGQKSACVRSALPALPRSRASVLLSTARNPRGRGRCDQPCLRACSEVTTGLPWGN